MDTDKDKQPPLVRLHSQVEMGSMELKSMLGFEDDGLVGTPEKKSFDEAPLRALYTSNSGNYGRRVMRNKLAAPLETLGRAAVELQMKKRTQIGIDLQFEWEEVDAFVRQPDGSLFSWCERFRCYKHLIYGIESSTYADTIILPMALSDCVS